jgi:4-hydroxy-tetrahydrodipicolinate reductase
VTMGSVASSLTRLVVVGARGRLGGLVVAAARAEQLDVVEVGRGDDLAAVLRAIPAGERCDSVVVDVALPGQVAERVAACGAAGVAAVVATTGLSAAEQAAVDDAARAIPVLQAANLSPGAHLAALLSGLAAKAMPDADVEVVEVHHRKKKDAPSGTALMLARAVNDARGGGARFVTSRDGEAPRQPGDIGVVAVRGGDVVGEHTISFFVDGERVEIVHKVSDRGIFARGALLAARFLVGRAPGRVTMQDVLRARVG